MHGVRVWGTQPRGKRKQWGLVSRLVGVSLLNGFLLANKGFIFMFINGTGVRKWRVPMWLWFFVFVFLDSIWLNSL